MIMKSLIKSIGWYLYGGVSCYCLQRFLVDFVYVKENAHEYFQSGDLIILDIFNRLQLTRNNLIYVISPDDHQKRFFGRVIAFSDDTINTRPMNTRVKLVKIPKGNVAVQILNEENIKDIRIIPMGLIEGRILARIWPLKRSTNHLLNMGSSTSDI